MARASSALTTRPVNVSSAARWAPTTRRRNQPPPSPAMRPRLMKVSPNCALTEPMRMSHMLARSKPAPIAGPLTAAITATSAACIARGMRWMLRR